MTREELSPEEFNFSTDGRRIKHLLDSELRLFDPSFQCFIGWFSGHEHILRYYTNEEMDISGSLLPRKDDVFCGHAIR